MTDHGVHAFFVDLDGSSDEDVSGDSSESEGGSKKQSKKVNLDGMKLDKQKMLTKFAEIDDDGQFKMKRSQG